MKKTTLLSALACTTLVAGSASAANIIWVDGSGGDANSDWLNLLETVGGHTVTTYTGSNAPTAGEQATLNAADVVIVARPFNNNSAAWDDLSVGLIMMNPYVIDDWGWGTGSPGDNDTLSVGVPTGAETDPIWDGITINSGDTADSIFVRFGIRGTGNLNIGGGGTILGTNDTDDQIVIARWDAGTVATGERIFFTGDDGDNSSYNLTTVGGTVFLNAVDSLVPEPSSLALLGLGGLCMMRRRRK